MIGIIAAMKEELDGIREAMEDISAETVSGVEFVTASSSGLPLTDCERETPQPLELENFSSWLEFAGMSSLALLEPSRYSLSPLG